MWLKVCEALATRYVLLILQQFFALGLSVLVFGICAIIHQQLVANVTKILDSPIALPALS